VSFATLECYKGNYSRYLTQRDERYKERMRRWEAQQEFIATTEEFIRRFLAGQRSKEAQGRRTRLARFMRDEAIPKPREHERINVRLKTTERTGDFVLYLNGLKAGYPPSPPRCFGPCWGNCPRWAERCGWAPTCGWATSRRRTANWTWKSRPWTRCGGSSRR
jgi:hypothetical protein